MEKKNNEPLSRRCFFKKAAYAALPMLGLMMSSCDIFQNALMNSVSNMGSGGGSYSGGSRSYDDGNGYGCGNYCTSTCKNLCTETCKNLCTETCKNLCTETCYHTSA